MSEQSGLGRSYRIAIILLVAIGWMRAGFKSIAYRLAHLSVPRFGVFSALTLAFFLI
ncbi:hypothetical protein [Pelagibacterium lentulum]|uniref:Uncharacterized protein n=1 Tax=Pelagibacterium lentulum TaxID=2029865 RepID=A0A916RMV0_9HYPH|nr:hypothetical protein [Pelagibacterium lentulum]GGA59892.1 hypothetical protein GCM10011499_32620 [Pelagibacterium lentulum]